MEVARGGCEGNALCLIQQAPTLEHHVLVLGCVGEMSGEFVATGVAIHHANVLGKPSRQVVQCVREAVRQNPPEGIIVWHGMVTLPEILHALRDFKGRVLVHAGNPAHTMPHWVDWRYWLREKWLGRRCEATYVCCSQYVADSFRHRRYLRRFPRVVVFNGVKPLSVPPHNPRRIAPGEPWTLGMTARLDGIKDHVTLLRAFALVLKTWPSARLELAGDGDQRIALEQLARDLGIVEQVKFLGMVRDVYAVMQHWDVFAYATTEREGLGNALTEAMMLGLPCVATNVGPIEEVAGHPPAIKLVSPNETPAFSLAIGALLKDESLRRKIGVTARQRALAEYSIEVFAGRYEKLLDLESFSKTSLP
jgi:glycosyltransferase involved in cell wall biosynthesis